jgi:PAS domain S-box-containing protein
LGDLTVEALMNGDPISPTGVGGEAVDVSVHQIRYREIFEFAPDAYLVTDGRGVILEANLASSLLLHCTKEFLIGKPLGLFVAEGWREPFYQCLARLNTRACAAEFETRVGQRKDKPLHDVTVRVAAIDTGEGESPVYRWLIRDITPQRHAEATRDELLRRIVTAQEDERRRIARELHDSVGQLLTALLLGLRSVRDHGSLSGSALARLDEVQQIADELGRAAHGLAVRLRPTVLDDVGLVPALRHELAEWSARTGVEVQFQAVGLQAERFPAEIETTLYRIVQESLTNVAKHARAGVVSVVLERQGGRAIAVVEDNGVGFDVEETIGPGHLGLLGMGERAALVGGALDIESSPGLGTTVLVRIPLCQRSEEAGRDRAR